MLGHEPLAIRCRREGWLASYPSPIPWRGENFQPSGNLLDGPHKNEGNLRSQAWKGCQEGCCHVKFLGIIKMIKTTDVYPTASPPISTIRNVLPLKMPVPSLDSKSSVSSTSPLPLLLLTVSTDKQKRRRMSSSSTWVEELLMCLYSISAVECSPSKPPLVTPTWVVKILTIPFWSTLRTSLRGRPSMISRKTPVPSDV